MAEDIYAPFQKLQNPVDFDAIRIKLASPERIREWSYGEVKKPETINYLTFKPERDGLFCAKIFGPIKDWECICGKYTRMKHRGIVCDRCGVEVIQSKVRRERLGHIELAAPVAHIWYLRSRPSIMGTLLDMSTRDLEKVLYFESYIVIDPVDTPLKRKELLSGDAYRKAIDKYNIDYINGMRVKDIKVLLEKPDLPAVDRYRLSKMYEQSAAFKTKIGAEAIRELLATLDLNTLSAELRLKIRQTQAETIKAKLARRLRLVESFRKSENKPDWMIMDVIPVLPPDLRPLVPLEGGRFATSDLNDLYRRVINRNNRLKRLIELKAPSIIIKNEKHMLQEAVDALFDNGRRSKILKTATNRPLKSLSDMIKGKEGRFRQNLLGKRVDYSGRSVIVVGPELRLHQCGLPKRMALELFKPFIFSKLEEKGYATTIKAAKKLVEKESPEVWDALEEVIRETPVLLNRAPTLHRLGIQAFHPVLVEGKAIRLHPLVCKAFNADFDGDQMAVHVPLSIEAQIEARVLMSSVTNILSPSNGLPVTELAQDIVLGIHYLTKAAPESQGTMKAFSGIADVRQAYDAEIVAEHTRIRVNIDDMTHETTAGRVLLHEILPCGIPFQLINKTICKDDLRSIIRHLYHDFGPKDTVDALNRLTRLGFQYATTSGISVCMDDFRTSPCKDMLIAEVRDKEKEVFNSSFSDEEQEEEAVSAAAIDKEKYMLQHWEAAIDNVNTATKQEYTKADDGFNCLRMMVHSGARGTWEQLCQLSGMKGLVAGFGKSYRTKVVSSSYKEGLSAHEFYMTIPSTRRVASYKLTQLPPPVIFCAGL